MRTPSPPRRVLVGLFLSLLATSAVQAEVHVVTIDSDNFTYSPAQLSVRLGDSVQFEASGFHPLRSDDGLFSCSTDCEVSFESAGDFGFFCFNHGGPGGGGMSGLIRVEDPDAIFASGFETLN